MLLKEMGYPFTALYGGEDGLQFFRDILFDANRFLNESGIICFEHNLGETENIIEIIREYFPQALIVSKKDSYGRERMLFIYT